MEAALASGARTADLIAPWAAAGERALSTRGMGEAVLAALQAEASSAG